MGTLLSDATYAIALVTKAVQHLLFALSGDVKVVAQFPVLQL